MAVKEIVKDTNFLTQKSGPFNLNYDGHIIQDLLDTANAHKNCAGLAAVQIGHLKRAIVVWSGDKFTPLINPVIIKRNPKTYMAEEGCLSLDSKKTVKRHKTVMVMWTDLNGKRKTQSFYGYIAQIIQHEVDHLNGVLI